MQYTYRGAYLNALNEVIVAGLGADSAYLWTLRMFHCNGWCFPWAVTAIAARHVTTRAVDAELIWELIDGEGVTHHNGAPTVQLMVLNHPRAHRLERPVTAMVAAAPPSPTLLARMSELNFRVVHVYGLTETYGPITVCPEQEAWRELSVEQRARYLARQGQAYISSDLVRVVDEQMTDVPQNGQAMGEVIMRGNNVMSGYFNDEAATRKAFAGGWFHSGTWPSGIPTATSSCATAARTSSSPVARTSPASKPSRRSPPTRLCSNARSSGSRTRTGGSGRRHSSRSTRALNHGERGGMGQQWSPGASRPG